MTTDGSSFMGRARRLSSIFRLTPLPSFNGNRRQSVQGADGAATTDTATDGEGAEADGFVFRVGPGCILGGGVLASLLGVEGAVEWKDEVRNGAPNVGCEAGATAIAATERYG